MWIAQVLRDLDDDPDGNIQHIAEHGITIEEVEDVLYGTDQVSAGHSSGRPISFGETRTGKHIAVVFDVVDEDPLAVSPVTAYEANP